MQNTLRVKLIEILRENFDDEGSERGEIGYSSNKFVNKVADQILSLIIESLPEEAEVPKGKHRGKSFCPQCEDTGYNAYREELIKMLKAL